MCTSAMTSQHTADNNLCCMWIIASIIQCNTHVSSFIGLVHLHELHCASITVNRHMVCWNQQLTILQQTITLTDTRYWANMYTGKHIQLNIPQLKNPTYPLRGRSWIERRCGSRAMRNLYSIGKIYIASALLYCRGLCVRFLGQAWRWWLKLYWCAVKPYSLTHSLTLLLSVTLRMHMPLSRTATYPKIR